ncbi:tigger transposable element-derived protein 4-like [Dermacentor andersoni]|uniref:tigger transposable element-derived protein 4-like n=1 Tax=Dermacentor andersoni TaxID=34620 RepID=UPI003B3BCFC6
MDQGVISSLKRHYRRSLLQRMLICMESGKENTVNLLSSVHLLTSAWGQVTEVTIANAFHHAGFMAPSDSSAQNDCDTMSEDSTVNLEQSSIVFTLSSKGVSIDMSAYVSIDEGVQTCRAATLEGLIEEVFNLPSETAADDDSMDVVPESAQVICNAADTCLDTLVQFFEQCKGTEEYLRKLSEMSAFVAARGDMLAQCRTQGNCCCTAETAQQCLGSYQMSRNAGMMSDISGIAGVAPRWCTR